MRAAFANTLAELAERDPRILLLSGDLGYMALEPFSDKFPDRFFNVGVAEQNMVGLATGLAESGFIPFVYSIVTFASLRPYEFIRNGPILHQLPVRIVGVGGGFEYGTAGPTHHGLEDIGVMRVQPGISVIAPADHRQARAAFLATWDMPGPVYYRIGKDDKTVVPGLDGRFQLGRGQVIREGESLIIITMGSIATEATAAAEALSAQGIECAVMVVACLNPPPIEDLSSALNQHRLAITLEAHYTVGGIGSLVSEVIAERGIDCRVVRCGVKETPSGVSGSQAYLHRANGISSEALVETVLGIYSGAVR
ncbi:MAG TPA: transketolase C-terminal domain-containing protein [Chloroflexia bacterium]|nr:transketolase C-terminal domain-containing protein [Chloroflexia bacterium]